MVAHPRSRGENDTPFARAVTQAGSSPLTRGKLTMRSATGCPYGLIPAHAGKTDDDGAGGGGRGGSSPLTRGKLPNPGPAAPPGGLIPAHAGKTHARKVAKPGDKAHPRSRGENRWLRPAVSKGAGSSPLTRGKHQAARSPWVSMGLIPAHAGKTPPGSMPRRASWAHPRSRGENFLSAGAVRFRAGSSPLTRGKHFLTCTFIAQIGQILESLELCASFESYSLSDAYATDAPRDRVRSIGLAPPSSRAASSA